MIPNGQDHMEEDDLVVVVTTKKDYTMSKTS